VQAPAEEIWAILRDVAASQKETDRKFQDTDRRFQDTDRKFQDTDRKFQETDRKLKEVVDSIGRLGNRLGEFVEEMVKPALVRLFRERGIEVHEVHRGVSAERHGEAIEIDLMVVNETEVVAVECKNKLSVDDVDEHLARLARLRRLLPRYREARVMGAVAAIVLPDDVARYAYRKGLFVLAQSGDSVIIRNDARFVPAIW
jgi:hypothetical protein